MVGNIQQLSAKTQHALKFAACINSQFDITTLATILEKSPQQTASDLQNALINGQLLPLKKERIPQTTTGI
ncbi:MAG: hypothetical protein DRR16_06120 [Candidatus Parabeggiatoa sp. nov. 3]|nr:MAG: hypothetical protein DRR00_34165 [Gammaproteobacteria bacterium]RKZ67560.1 MAG: hypothetical protein DRQ99_06435 [Gammaproteobacteria bacterium]RKZ87957.1 MAG: hypothetical protein DRR16_06120 [Gammaproteobacteria bacterium]